MDIELTEERSTPPQGLEGFTYYRVEYGGTNKECIYECGIWLPNHINSDEVEVILNQEQEHIESIRGRP